MDEKKFISKLGKIRSSRLNQIIYAVNCKVPEKEIGLNGEVEKMFYDSLIEQANEHVKKHGFWPVFEMCEIETDDPVLDIYND